MAGISAGVAYIDVLPNMGKFAPALSGQTSAASGVLSKFAKFGTLAVGAVGAGSVKMAADFEGAMRNVNSIARLPEPAFDSLNEKVLALAGPTAQAPQTLAEGLYDLVSSGFDSAEALKILKASAFAATAGLTDTATSTKAVAAVLNAYRLPASKASQVSDQLFKTVDQGVISFEELSTNIGDTLPFAASLGVGLDEIGGATATMTKQGLGASETFTRIRNLLQTMIKPGAELTSAIKGLGYESGEALIREKGLQGSLEALIGTTGGTKDEVAALFPNIRALGGALALTGDNSKAARADLDALGDSAGATKRAFEEQSKSLTVQWQRLMANLQALAIRIGNVLLPAITGIVKWLNTGLGPALREVGKYASAFGRAIVSAVQGAIRWVRQAIENVKGFARSFIPLKIAVGAVKAALYLLKPAISLVMGIGKAMLKALEGGFKVVGAAVKMVWGIIKGLGAVIGDVIGVASNLLRGDFAGAWKNIKELVASLAGLLKGTLSGAFGIVKAAMGGLKGVATAIFGAIRGTIEALIGTVKDLGGVIGEVMGKIGDAIAGVQTLINLVDSAADKISGLAGAKKYEGGARADGGPVERGGTYLVGERGAELFTPSSSGTIIPNHRLAAAGAAGFGSGRYGLTITNWRDGTGYIRELAAGEVAEVRRFDTQRARMRGTR